MLYLNNNLYLLLHLNLSYLTYLVRKSKKLVKGRNHKNCFNIKYFIFY